MFLFLYSCLLKRLFCTRPNQIITLNRSFWYIFETLKDATTHVQSGPGSNGNENILHTPHIYRPGWSSSGIVSYYTKDSPWGILPIHRGYRQRIINDLNRAKSKVDISSDSNIYKSAPTWNVSLISLNLLLIHVVKNIDTNTRSALLL